MRGLLVVGALIVALVVGAWLLKSNPTWIYDVNGDALGSSLARATDGSGGTCKPDGAHDRWQCGVEMDPGSGSAASYDLVSDDDGCWTAKRDQAATHPRHVYDPISGCAKLWDFVWPDRPGLG